MTDRAAALDALRSWLRSYFGSELDRPRHRVTLAAERVVACPAHGEVVTLPGQLDCPYETSFDLATDAATSFKVGRRHDPFADVLSQFHRLPHRPEFAVRAISLD